MDTLGLKLIFEQKLVFCHSVNNAVYLKRQQGITEELKMQWIFYSLLEMKGAEES